VATFRPEYQHRWSSKKHYSQIRLDALPARSAGELLDALLGQDAALAPLKQLLIKRGNPFFLEETVRTLVEKGAGRRAGALSPDPARRGDPGPSDRSGDAGGSHRQAR